jgi:murein DD-endopeptidase MepM/ murein hydrolase activator NlpD
MSKTILKSLIILSFLFTQTNVYALSVSELEDQIKVKNEDIRNLQSELSKLRSELSELNNQSKTLGNAVAELDTTRKKLLTEIKITEDKIGKANNSIDLLEYEIGEKETSINKTKKAIVEGIRKMHEIDSRSFAYNILSQKNFSESLGEIDTIIQFQKSLRDKSEQLRIEQDSLSKTIKEQEEVRQELVSFKSEVLGQKEVVEKNKSEKDLLLKQTKNQEAEYQKIIAEKERLRAEFEAELNDYESRLSFILDPKSVPEAKNGVLAWPLDNILITQGFGLTKDSAKLYSHRQGAWNGKHTGVDFRANNDPVKAMASGTVIGSGNTDLVCPRASFGGWILIKYDNGLASIYSHMSTVTVKNNQKVKAGDIVGYSGNTGYSTGPHLDVKVVPASAVTIETWPSKGCAGKNYTTPIVAGGTYFDPLSYLPKTTDAMWK